MVTFNLLINAVVTGILLGGFYAAVTVESPSPSGMLDIVNIAHPVFIIMGSFIAYIVNRHFGFDPILTVIVAAPLFFLLGIAIFRFYYAAFESSGKGSLRGLAFFFGIMFVIEVTLLLAFGVDYRLVQTSYRPEYRLRAHRSANAHGGPVRRIRGAGVGTLSFLRSHVHGTRDHGGGPG